MRQTSGLAVRTLCGALGVLAGCASTPDDEYLGSPRATAVVGTVHLTGTDASPAEPSKVIVTSFIVSSAGAVAQPVIVAYGATAAPPAAWADLSVELVASDGRPLSRREATDPRRVIVENGGNVQASEALLVVRLPFHAHAERALLHDSAGTMIAETDVGAAIRSFCADVDDEECEPARVSGGATDSKL